MGRRLSTAWACAPLLASIALLPGCTGAEDAAAPLGEAADAQTVCAAGETVEGIDVSVWQADVDWQAVRDSGVTFGIARVSYGTDKDDYFDGNWAGMKAAGIVRGAYQYFLADQDPIVQAELMLQAMGTLGEGDLPPVVDVESTEGQSAATIADRLGQWMAHVEAAIGRKPIIYTGKYFWQDSVASGAFSGYPLWIPNYSYDCPDLPDGYWDNWVIFQYTDANSVPGVSGNVDGDRFNGSLQDLLAFANGGPRYAAEFVSQSFPYASEGKVTIQAGDVGEAYIELRNVGTQPWDGRTRLAATEPRDRDSAFAGPEWPAPNRFAEVEGIVQPGETYRFTFQIHAPRDPGVYDEFFGLVQEGETWFSDPGQGGPPDNLLEGVFEVLPAAPEGQSGSGADPSAGDEDTGCSIRRPARSGSWISAWSLLALGALAARRRRQGLTAPPLTG